jgi:2-hydroxychromene-2-carboxylate isomerase
MGQSLPALINIEEALNLHPLAPAWVQQAHANALWANNCLEEAPVGYYFTPVSPWAFLGHARFMQLLRDCGATVSVRPVDFGAIFPASGGLPLAKRAPQRQAYRLVELKRFADALQVPLNPQPKFFPVPADPAALLIVAAGESEGEDVALELAGRFGTAVWVEQRDIGDEATRRAIVAEAGLPNDLHARAAAPAATPPTRSRRWMSASSAPRVTSSMARSSGARTGSTLSPGG